jgi:hypothetical protein
LAHSILGERYILIRLFRRKDLPHLFGGPEFTVRTIRFAWHLMTVAWWGLAAILVLLACESLSAHSVSCVLAVTFVVTSAITAVVSRGRHLAWPVFLIIGIVCAWAAANERRCSHRHPIPGQSKPIVRILCLLEHYLSDADIRERDVDYAAMQKAELAKLISLLSEGAVEEASAIPIPWLL